MFATSIANRKIVFFNLKYYIINIILLYIYLLKNEKKNKYNCVIRGNGVVCRYKVLVLEMRIDNE